MDNTATSAHTWRFRLAGTHPSAIARAAIASKERFTQH